eukprot:Opistho-1_new@83538
MGCTQSSEVKTMGTATSKALEDSQHGESIKSKPVKKDGEEDSSEYETDSDDEEMAKSGHSGGKRKKAKKEATFDHGSEPDDVAHIEPSKQRKQSRSSLDDMIDALELESKNNPRPPVQKKKEEHKESNGSLDDAVNEIMASGDNLHDAGKTNGAKKGNGVANGDGEDDAPPPPPAKKAFGDGKIMTAKDAEKEKRREEKEAKERDKAAAKARTKELKALLSEHKKKDKEVAKLEKDLAKRREKAAKKGESIPDDDPAIAAIARAKEHIASLDEDIKRLNGLKTGQSADDLDLSMNSNFSNSGSGPATIGGAKLNGHAVNGDGRSTPSSSIASATKSPMRKVEESQLPGMIDDPEEFAI